jgi:hypothetical protein
MEDFFACNIWVLFVPIGVHSWFDFHLFDSKASSVSASRCSCFLSSPLCFRRMLPPDRLDRLVELLQDRTRISIDIDVQHIRLLIAS